MSLALTVSPRSRKKRVPIIRNSSTSVYMHKGFLHHICSNECVFLDSIRKTHAVNLGLNLSRVVQFSYSFVLQPLLLGIRLGLINPLILSAVFLSGSYFKECVRPHQQEANQNLAGVVNRRTNTDMKPISPTISSVSLILSFI